MPPAGAANLDPLQHRRGEVATALVQCRDQARPDTDTDTNTHGIEQRNRVTSV